MAASKQYEPIMDAEEYIGKMADFHLPRYDEIPEIDLYMDQLIKYVSDQVNLLATLGDRPLTSSMVNNYVKQKLVPQPKAKRYERVHVAYLIVVCVLKRTFSIADIQRLIALEVRHHYQVQEAYDFFCTAFEESLRILFVGRTAVDHVGVLRLTAQEGAFSVVIENAGDINDARQVAISAATSAATKVLVDKRLDWLEHDVACSVNE